MALPPDDHRPWPTPSLPWVLFMRWQNLAFLHWPIPPEELRPHVPAELELETYDGVAWLGITPFIMCDVRARFTPALPTVSAFPELNVRTYVSTEGKPGVWFFSLDADHLFAVKAARRFYRLPYRRASMRMWCSAGWIEYRSERAEPGEENVRFHARYRPTGPARRSEPGTLEHWLTERYCLYSANADRLYRAEIHHAPWPLQPAEVEISVNSMTALAGIQLPDAEPLAHRAGSLDVVAWLPERVRRAKPPPK